jgi:YhcH/YjgK/YiaL family protein
MILDSLENFRTYLQLHPSFEKVFQYLYNTDCSNIEPGKIIFDNEPFYINVDENSLRNEKQAVLEAHNSYIDIQMPLTATEQIGYKQRSQCREIKEEFPERDIVFYNDKPDQLITLHPGDFAVFFPHDAHAPLIGTGTAKKIVAKIKVNI